jgi:hypothetical protein
MYALTANVISLRPRHAEAELDRRRLDAELLAAEVRGARNTLGVLATGAPRFR